MIPAKLAGKNSLYLVKNELILNNMRKFAVTLPDVDNVVVWVLALQFMGDG